MFNLDAVQHGVQNRPPRIILLGVPKIGKSTFASQSGKAIILPIKGEEGVDDLDVGKATVSMTYRDTLGWLGSLHSQPHDYTTAVIDSASALQPLIWDETCRANGNVDSIEKVGGGYGKGFTEALKYWQAMTEWLDALRTDRGMASIIIGHVKVKRFDDPIAGSYDQYQFDIDDRAANLLYRWADVILFCNTKTVVLAEDVGFNKEKKTARDITEGQRFLYTQKRPSHPGGGRGVYGRLPYEIPLHWSSFCDAITTAMQQPVT